MTYDRTNTGIIAKNDRKTQDNHPDITGSINVDGREYWLNGWHKTGSKGPFYSLSVKPKDAERPSRAAQDDYRAQHDDDPDSIPF